MYLFCNFCCCYIYIIRISRGRGDQNFLPWLLNVASLSFFQIYFEFLFNKFPFISYVGSCELTEYNIPIGLKIQTLHFSMRSKAFTNWSYSSFHCQTNYNKETHYEFWWMKLIIWDRKKHQYYYLPVIFYYKYHL